MKWIIIFKYTFLFSFVTRREREAVALLLTLERRPLHHLVAGSISGVSHYVSTVAFYGVWRAREDGAKE